MWGDGWASWQQIAGAVLTARNGNLDLPGLVEDLLRTMTFSWHFCLPSKGPVTDLSTGHV